MLDIKGMTCVHGAFVAAAEVDLRVDAGEILALIGANGAGKTSTLMAAMGHVRIVAGSIEVAGVDISGRDAKARPALGLAIVPEGRQLFRDLTVDDNLTVGGYTRPKAETTRARQRVYDLFPRLAERRWQVAGTMSGGEQQMLAIGRAMMVSPKVLLVDELSLGLMPKAIDSCLDTLVRLRRDGTAIVLVEQNTDRALAVADRVVVLAAGRVAASGTPAVIRAGGDVFDAYLGLPSAPPPDLSPSADETRP